MCSILKMIYFSQKFGHWSGSRSDLQSGLYRVRGVRGGTGRFSDGTLSSGQVMHSSVWLLFIHLVVIHPFICHIHIRHSLPINHAHSFLHLCKSVQNFLLIHWFIHSLDISFIHLSYIHLFVIHPFNINSRAIHPIAYSIKYS